MLAVRPNGAVKTVPAKMPLVKNWTSVSVPLDTTTSAAMLTLAGATNTAPPGGLVMVTLTVGGGTTVMFTTADVAEIPDAVATAVSA